MRSLGPWRSAGTVSGWRFPRDLAGNLCALRGDRGADTARRAEILERRSAGGLRRPQRGAAAAFSRGAEDAGLIAVSKFLVAPVKQPVSHELPQLRGAVELKRHHERHNIFRPTRKSLAAA